MRLTLLLFLLAIFSCYRKEKIEASKDNFTFYPNMTGNSEDKKSLIKERSYNNRIFNLPDLFNGSKDSLEIRIWPWGAFDWRKDVFVFRFANGGWNGFHYNSLSGHLKLYEGNIISYKDQQDFEDSVFIAKEIVPGCDWVKFADSISFFQIPVLPTQDSIKDFRHINHTDGNGCSFEIATPSSYRYLYYDIPESYQYKECRQIEEFIAMLKRQLGKDYHWPRHQD
jgi:hypothetical protein